MAERSFEREVQDLRLQAGEIFRGEGILAITKALLQSGVSYVAGYQGAPISHLMDVLADAKDVMSDLGVHFETSASEATAAATLSASVMYPVRGAVTFKSTAGANVAADALSNLASSGVTGGALIVIGEDYGEGSSIMQERSHAYAMKSQIWLLDPRPDLPTLVRMVEEGFELSEASNSPVMLEVRIRTCHVHGQFVAKDNKKPDFTLRQALENPSRDLNRIVLPPASFMQEKEKLEKRWPAAVEFIKSRKLNEFFGPKEGAVGIIVLGGLFNGVLRALQQLGLADVYRKTSIPIYVLNVAYPIIDDEMVEFCLGKCPHRSCRRRRSSRSAGRRRSNSSRAASSTNSSAPRRDQSESLRSAAFLTGLYARCSNWASPTSMANPRSRSMSSMSPIRSSRTRWPRFASASRRC